MVRRRELRPSYGVPAPREGVTPPSTSPRREETSTRPPSRWRNAAASCCFRDMTFTERFPCDGPAASVRSCSCSCSPSRAVAARSRATFQPTSDPTPRPRTRSDGWTRTIMDGRYHLTAIVHSGSGAPSITSIQQTIEVAGCVCSRSSRGDDAPRTRIVTIVCILPGRRAGEPPPARKRRHRHGSPARVLPCDMLIRPIVRSPVKPYTGTLRRSALQIVAIGIAALSIGCASSVTGNDAAYADSIGANTATDATEREPDAPRTATDAAEREPNAVCMNGLTTWDCPRFVADEICARNPPCHVCPQDWFPDGGSDTWMAVQQPPSCPCPPPMNGGPPHPG